MNDVIGIIDNTKNNYQLKELMYGRTMASVPFGGRYRMIDFALSNMINSGIQNVGILVNRNYRSLLGHVRSPKEWDLDRKRDGLFILPPDSERHAGGTPRGNLDILYSNLDYIARSKQSYVLISDLNILNNIDYGEVLNFHRETGRDITIVYKDMDNIKGNISGCASMKIDDCGRILDMQVEPRNFLSGKISMGIFIMRKDLLVDIVSSCVSRGKYDLVKDGIISNLNKLRVYGFSFNGYSGIINSIDSYYKCSMDILNPHIWKELFFEAGSIYTKVKDLAPARYTQNSRVKNSLIANGCVIDGSVENSILFRGVKVGDGVKIRNSIIMQNCNILSGTVLENVIIDKDSVITENRFLAGAQDYPMVIEKKSVI